MIQIHCERPSTGQIWDMMAIGDITVSKSKNEPGSLQATFLRDKMTVENGDIIAVQLNEKGMDDFNLFYGYVWKTQKQTDEVTVTAYDQLFQLQKSKDFKVYGDIKASDLYIRMSDEHNLYMLNPPNVKDTEYTIPGVIADNTSPLDLLTEALNITYENTGKQYYFYDFFRNLCMEEQVDMLLPKERYEINVDNIKSYSYDEDKTEYVNEVIIQSDDENNTTLAVRRDDESIKRDGRITFTDKVKEGMNADIVATNTYLDKRRLVPEMSVTVYGCNPQVVPGRLVHVDLYSGQLEYIYGWFGVEDVTFTLSGGTGTMDLKLRLFNMEAQVFGS